MPRAQKGDVRRAILLLLDEAPRNGYELMGAVEERSDGIWRLSPGSVYPTLAALEGECLVRAVNVGGRRTFSITDAGRACLDNREPPWLRMREATPISDRDLYEDLSRLMGAVDQLAVGGTPKQRARAHERLAATLRALQLVLADGTPAKP